MYRTRRGGHQHLITRAAKTTCTRRRLQHTPTSRASHLHRNSEQCIPSAKAATTEKGLQVDWNPVVVGVGVDVDARDYFQKPDLLAFQLTL